MPKYRVKELSLIGNELHQANAIVDYDGLPSENLEPQDAEGEAKHQEYLKLNQERIEKMQRDNSNSQVGDPQAFAKALADFGVTQNEALSAAISAGIAAGIAQAMTPAEPATGKGKAVKDAKESLV